MKRVKWLFPMGLIILLFFTVSCKKDEQSSVGFMMKATDALAPVQSPDQQPPKESMHNNLQLGWNIAWIYITHLEFDAEFYGFSDILGKNKYPDFHYDWQGNQKIDLLGEPKIFAQMELPEGQFKSFEMVMTSARFGYTDEPNFFLSGFYGPPFGGTPVSVAVTTEFEMEFSYEHGEAISTDEGAIFKSLVEISLDHVFDGITAEEMDNAKLTEGWIQISENHNPALYAKILENLTGERETGFTWGIHKIQ